MPSLVELQEEIHVKRGRMNQIREQAGPDWDMARVTCLEGDSESKLAEMRRLNDDLARLCADEERLAHMKALAENNAKELERLDTPVGGMVFPNGNGSGQMPTTHARVPMSLRKMLQDNPGWKAFREGHIGTFSLDLPGADIKTLVTLTTISPQNVRQGDLVTMALEERTVADLMSESTINRGVVEYYEETTVTNAATTVAEGGTKPESALGYTLRTETARKIATNIPVTKEALDDNAFLEGQIRGRLAFMVKRVEETQLLTGDGTGVNIRGLLNRTGIQTQARGAETNMDAVLRAMQLIRGSAGAGFAEPTGIVMHPANWTTVKLAKTADGLYLWGTPADEGPDRLWGKMVRQTTAMTSGTALVGAFRPHAEVLRREGINVIMSTEHSNFVVLNQVLLQAEERLALAVYRPAAFCTVTGLS